jgi:NAD(P)-dependent dehydrogenase (short-subunit alcohol dehydrogenase family)
VPFHDAINRLNFDARQDGAHHRPNEPLPTGSNLLTARSFRDRPARQVAIVTGAASYRDDDPYQVGAGAATASTLARLGAAFVLADINGAVAEKCAEAIRSKAGVAGGVEADACIEEHVQRMAAAAVKHFGCRLDTLPNNAAGSLRRQ